jgi:coenzyme F420-0:L-glutamate ligase / coenzyme F420-1:gamma-L-glutamate ligase
MLRWLLYNQSIMSESEIVKIIRGRRAIRRFQDHPVPKELLEKLFDTALWAPSAHNRQPWRFAVLTSAQDIKRLALAMGERLRSDRLQDGDSPEIVERDVARSYARITGAPVVIGVFLSMAEMDRYPDQRRSRAEETMAVQSVAMAAQNLWLLAHAEGLGACWLCAPLFVPELVRDILQLPVDWQAQGLMTLGWPAEEKVKTRQPWPEFVHFL